MLKNTLVQLSPYAKFRYNSHFYKSREKVKNAYGVRPNQMRKLNVKPGLLSGVYTHQKIDYRDKAQLDELEAIRHPRERDFYQDHTFQNQWIARKTEDEHKKTLISRYSYFGKDFQKSPWIWYPGDIVEVTSGEHAGQRGSIIAVIQYKNLVLVQNVNVQDVTIPASETRPEQTVQREHPIPVDVVKHVDPSTSEVCDVRLVKVKNKQTGEMEEKRMSMSSGVLLPIPPKSEDLELGDPLKDTPLLDAEELTYDAQKEMPLLVERKLQAIENYFVLRLKESYLYHSQLSAKNEDDMRNYQRDVFERAVEHVSKDIAAGKLEPVLEWMKNDVETEVEDLRAAAIEQERIEMEKRAASAGASQNQKDEEEGDEDADDESDEGKGSSAEEEEVEEGHSAEGDGNIKMKQEE